MAQTTTGDAGAVSSDPFASGRIRITPPMPDGGVYGVTTDTPGVPDAGVVAPPSPSMQASATTSSVPTTTTSNTANTSNPTTVIPTVTTPNTTTGPAVPPPPPGVLAPTAADDDVPSRRGSLLRARLRLLNTTLLPLAERSRRQRIIDSVISIGMGAGIGALGFLVPASPGNDLRPYIWVAGGSSMLSGVINLMWVPARETLSSQFEAMPIQTAQQRRARVRFGEQALEEIAADGARRRTLGAIAGALVSVGTLAAIYHQPLFSGTPYPWGVQDAIIIGFTGLSALQSLLQLLGRSDDERLRDEYWQQVNIMRAERGMEPVSLR